MEFEDQELEEEIGLPEIYNSLGNSSRAKMSSPAGVQGPPSMEARKPRYRECLKNHAVGIGGHGLDGCLEFMAAGEEGTLDALKCAACNCHRNFHRKETETVNGGEAFNFVHHQHHLLSYHQPHQQFSPYYRTPSGYLHVAPHQRALPLPSTSGGGGSHSREDQEDMSNPTNTSNMGAVSKKRFRTKFTQEQKDKLLSLAERLDWRIQKHDEAVVQQFCNDTGLKRHVLKIPRSAFNVDAPSLSLSLPFCDYIHNTSMGAFLVLPFLSSSLSRR
ncbi:hypothetical protein F0562_003173 [Nyssa sinensis]|uniref:ZF-HD dimerization-type domain-containing protein n=1 Tax=Nyssa sinensis TaxID=561372 RepID=A0A5J5BVS9_9ASTE|nr:hypothetical protein F0562_003173 [Nyssa sinensis]